MLVTLDYSCDTRSRENATVNCVGSRCLKMQTEFKNSVYANCFLKPSLYILLDLLKSHRIKTEDESQMILLEGKFTTMPARERV